MFDLFSGRVMERYCKKLECNELPVANYFDEKMPHKKCLTFMKTQPRYYLDQFFAEHKLNNMRRRT